MDITGTWGVAKEMLECIVLFMIYHKVPWGSCSHTNSGMLARRRLLPVSSINLCCRIVTDSCELPLGLSRVPFLQLTYASSLHQLCRLYLVSLLSLSLPGHCALLAIV